MSRSILHLLIIDPQNDFCIADDGFGNKGALVVPGAEADMNRLAAMITRLGSRIDDISVTFDCHQTIGIERPRWWKRLSDGAEPAPFTCLGIHPDGRRIVAYVMGGSNPNAFGMSPTEEAYTTYLPEMLHQGGSTGKGSFGYLQALAARGRYPHIVWTEHCRVGSWGASAVPVLDRALYSWERKEFGRVNYIAKGNNPWTEHFSAVAAEVPDPGDTSTQINTRFIQTLEQATKVALTGEALSHCLANTGRDIASAFSDPRFVEKLVLIDDCASNVGGFDFLGAAFVRDLQALGMQRATSVDFLA